MRWDDHRNVNCHMTLYITKGLFVIESKPLTLAWACDTGFVFF